MLFDIGNVLLFFSHERMCEQIATVLATSSSAVDRMLFQSGLAERYDVGAVDTEDVLGRLATLSSKPIESEALRRAAADIFESNAEIAPLVEGLRRLGIRRVLLSNTCEVHSSYAMRAFPILRDFDDRVLSWEVGARKPEPKIFELAVERAQCLPSECLFVDDIAAYTEAARAYGIDAITFEGVEKLRLGLLARGLDLSPVGAVP